MRGCLLQFPEHGRHFRAAGLVLEDSDGQIARLICARHLRTIGDLARASHALLARGSPTARHNFGHLAHDPHDVEQLFAVDAHAHGDGDTWLCHRRLSSTTQNWCPGRVQHRDDFALRSAVVLVLHIGDKTWFGHAEHKALPEFLRHVFEDLSVHAFSTALA